MRTRPTLPGGTRRRSASASLAISPRTARVLVRYRSNDYSVPTTYGFRLVVVKGFVEEGRDPVRRRRDRPASTLATQSRPVRP